MTILLLLLLALQPTVGFSLLSDFLPFRPLLTHLSPPSYSHYLYIFFDVLNPSFPWSSSVFLPVGFHSSTLLSILFSSIRITWPSQGILLVFTNPNISAFFIRSFSSEFILILQNPSSFCTGPKIFLIILRSNIQRYCSPRFVNVQASNS